MNSGYGIHTYPNMDDSRRWALVLLCLFSRVAECNVLFIFPLFLQILLITSERMFTRCCFLFLLCWTLLVLNKNIWSCGSILAQLLVLQISDSDIINQWHCSTVAGYRYSTVYVFLWLISGQVAFSTALLLGNRWNEGEKLL